MVTTLRIEDRLDGSTNFKSWNTRILFILEHNEIEDNVKIVIHEPTDNEGKSKHKKNEAKAKRILVNSVKYHLIPHIAQLNTSKETYDALIGLFENDNPSRKLALRNQLCGIKMSRSNTIATYFMKVS